MIINIGQYLCEGGNNCPSCSSDKISAVDRPERDGDGFIQPVLCESCGALWSEFYSLTNLINFREGKKRKKPGVGDQLAIIRVEVDYSYTYLKDKHGQEWILDDFNEDELGVGDTLLVIGIDNNGTEALLQGKDGSRYVLEL